MADSLRGGIISDQETSSPFETIRHTTDDSAEYWSARELAEVLGYAKWANFVPTIKDAKKACEGSGQTVSDHFLETREMVALGSGSQRAVDDFHLSRYACYLVVQNADPSKPIVALGQTYFAVRTREAELAEEAATPLSPLDGVAQEQVLARLFDAEDSRVGSVRWREGGALYQRPAWPLGCPPGQLRRERQEEFIHRAHRQE